MKTLTIILLSIIAYIFSGCAVVDRGNFPQMVIGELSQSWKNSYDVIDTSKEDIGITKPPHSPIVERFEVRNGGCAGRDCGGRNGRNYGDRERIELKEDYHQRNTYDGKEYWYTWDIYFPKDFKSVYPTHATFGQFYAVTEVPYSVVEKQDALYLRRPTVSGRDYSTLVKKGELRGKWHTFVLHIKWSSDPNIGFFEIWVDGELKYQKTERTYIGGTPYFKYGIYRAYISKYKTKHGGIGGVDFAEVKLPEYPTLDDWVKVIREAEARKCQGFKKNDYIKLPTQVVYYSHVRRANTKEELWTK